MKFKTNANCGGCKAAIIGAMQERFPDMEWAMDLESADKILECHGIPDNPDKAAEIVRTIEETGFKGNWIPADA